MSTSIQRQHYLAGRNRRYRLRRSRRAKNILLHVDTEGKIEVVVPWRVSYRQGERFLREKAAWIEQRLQAVAALQRQAPSYRVRDGAQLPFLGATIRLNVQLEEDRRRTFVKRQGDVLVVRARSQVKAREAVTRWYQEQSREYFWNQADAFALQLGVRVHDVQVRDTKSQWGSCNKQKKALSFQWKLALAPMPVIFYVVAHEVAHLRRADHSEGFWKLVELLDPMYKQAQQWLKYNGHTLKLR